MVRSGPCPSCGAADVKEGKSCPICGVGVPFGTFGIVAKPPRVTADTNRGFKRSNPQRHSWRPKED